MEGSTGSLSMFLSQGTIEPQWVAHSWRMLPFSAGVRENKRPVSVLLVQWFFCFTHPTLQQIHSRVVPAAAARLAPLQPGQQPYSSVLQDCTFQLSQCGLGAPSPLFCFGDVSRSGRKEQVCSSWDLLSPDISYHPS